uniref:SCAN box domain-containing protein n=1 Tax=Chrysemys picta bellii TaxID=8478 RepID=A0A8C3H8U2_CHRPI
MMANISSCSARNSESIWPWRGKFCSISTYLTEPVDMEMHRLRFRAFHYQEAEGPREAYDHLCLLSRAWLRPEQRSKEQMLELLVLEQFLSILPQEIQSWVGGCHPQTREQAVALAEGFQLAKEEPGIWPQQEVIYGCEIIREWDMGPFPSRGRQLQSTHEAGGDWLAEGGQGMGYGTFHLGMGRCWL